MLQAAEGRRLQKITQESDNGLNESSRDTGSKRASKQPPRSKKAAESSKGPSLELERHDDDPDWLLAMRLQAEFDAEEAQAREDAGTTAQSPYTKNDAATGRPAEEHGATLRPAGFTVDADEELARRLQAAFNGGVVPHNAHMPENSYNPDTSYTPVQLPTTPAYSTSTGAERTDVLTSSASLQSFAKKLTQTTCATCQSGLLTRDFDVADLFIKWVTGKGTTFCSQSKRWISFCWLCSLTCNSPFKLGCSMYRVLRPYLRRL